MEPYIEFIGTLQNSGFWLVKVAYGGHYGIKEYRLSRPPNSSVSRHESRKAPDRQCLHRGMATVYIAYVYIYI